MMKLMTMMLCLMLSACASTVKTMSTKVVSDVNERVSAVQSKPTNGPLNVDEDEITDKELALEVLWGCSQPTFLRLFTQGSGPAAAKRYVGERILCTGSLATSVRCLDTENEFVAFARSDDCALNIDENFAQWAAVPDCSNSASTISTGAAKMQVEAAVDSYRAITRMGDYLLFSHDGDFKTMDITIAHADNMRLPEIPDTERRSFRHPSVPNRKYLCRVSM